MAARPFTSLSANLQIGLDYLRLDDRTNAEIFFRLTESDEIADFALSRILIRDGRAEEAVAILARLIERSPNSMRAHQMQGWAYEALGDVEEARNCFDRSMHTSEMITIHPISRDWDEKTVNKMGAAVPLTKSTNALEEAIRVRRSSKLKSHLNYRPVMATSVRHSSCFVLSKAGQPDKPLTYLKRWLIRDGESAYL